MAKHVIAIRRILKVDEGADCGWPYYYYDQMQGKLLLNPEYGGDGKKEGNAAKYDQPLIGFPGHFAPNDILFYTGNQFPERYKNGAFIAFHGSTIRAPYSQGGYFVAFVPFKEGKPSGPWEVLPMAFQVWIPSLIQATQMPARWAWHKAPTVPYMSASHAGEKFGALFTKGDKAKFGDADLAAMAKEKQPVRISKTLMK